MQGVLIQTKNMIVHAVPIGRCNTNNYLIIKRVISTI